MPFAGLKALRISMLFCIPIIVVLSLSAQLGDELPGRALQSGSAPVAATAAAACQPTAELADGGDDQVRQGIIG